MSQMKELFLDNETEFRQAVEVLVEECIGMFDRNVGSREIHKWADSIPERFPRYDICDLLSAVKESLDERDGGKNE